MPVQRPTDWWSIPGWWDELSHPLWRWLHVRLDVHACRCLLIGHRWSGTRVSRLEICTRMCCRGCERHAQRWSPGPPPPPPMRPPERKWKF